VQKILSGIPVCDSGLPQEERGALRQLRGGDISELEERVDGSIPPAALRRALAAIRKTTHIGGIRYPGEHAQVRRDTVRKTCLNAATTLELRPVRESISNSGATLYRSTKTFNDKDLLTISKPSVRL
jgi:hypothetical protein